MTPPTKAKLENELWRLVRKHDCESILIRHTGSQVVVDVQSQTAQKIREVYGLVYGEPEQQLKQPQDLS